MPEVIFQVLTKVAIIIAVLRLVRYKLIEGFPVCIHHQSG